MDVTWRCAPFLVDEGFDASSLARGLPPTTTMPLRPTMLKDLWNGVDAEIADVYQFYGHNAEIL